MRNLKKCLVDTGIISLSNQMSGKVDLHTHTSYSDGYYSPAELVIKDKYAGIDIL